MKVKSESEVAQSCQTLSDLMDCSLPGSSIHGIFQARVLEWGATAFSSISHISRCALGFCKLLVWAGGAVVKNPANAGNRRDMGSIPGSGRSPGVGTRTPLQYSCLESSMDRGGWWAGSTVHQLQRVGYDWAQAWEWVSRRLVLLPAMPSFPSLLALPLNWLELKHPKRPETKQRKEQNVPVRS